MEYEWSTVLGIRRVCGCMHVLYGLIDARLGGFSCSCSCSCSCHWFFYCYWLLVCCCLPNVDAVHVADADAVPC